MPQFSNETIAILDIAQEIFDEVHGTDITAMLAPNIWGKKYDSPLEEHFHIALLTVAKATSEKLYIANNHTVGKYRVDFLLTKNGTFYVIAEIDGHEFHDKNKQQREYEKRRDRYFAINGYKALHYAGTEIYRNPWIAAAEVIATTIDVPPKEIVDLIKNAVDLYWPKLTRSGLNEGSK